MPVVHTVPYCCAFCFFQQLLVAREELEGVEIVFPRSNTEFNVEVAKLPIIDRDTSKVTGCVMAYKLDIKIKIVTNFIELIFSQPVD